MSTCELVNLGDFELLIRDGSSPAVTYSIPMFGSFRYAPGGYAETEIRESNGRFSTTYAPMVGEEALTTWGLEARQTGGLGGANTSIATLTLDITHASSVSYEVELDVTRSDLGEYEPTRHVVAWNSGADAAATAANAITALTALFGSGATGSADVTLAFPAGAVVEVIGDDTGTGTVAASVAYTGGTIAGEIVLSDFVDRSGHYWRLTPTIALGACKGSHRVFDFGARAGGREVWFPRSTWSGEKQVTLEGMQITMQGRSRAGYPEHVAE